jgi:hypothetical protein
MNVAYRVTKPDAIEVTLATIGTALISVGAVQTAGLHQNVWSNPWFDGGCAVVAFGALPIISVMASWWRALRHKAPDPVTDAEGSAPVPSGASPLLMRPGKADWRLFDDTVWAFGIPVRVTNVVDEPITLARYRLLSGSGITQCPPLSQEVRDAVDSWLAKLSSAHESELFVGEITVPPGESITRWFVNWAYAPLPDGGPPALTLQIKDVLNNAYELDIPAHPPETYRLP